MVMNMAGCTCENWSLQDLSNALRDMHKDNKRIVVPMFQRGKRWKRSQEEKFIDSLIKGYPVGTMLFYETYEDNKRTYILVDGLQRGNSIKKYMMNPTAFFMMIIFQMNFVRMFLHWFIGRTIRCFIVKLEVFLLYLLKNRKLLKICSISL